MKNTQIILSALLLTSLIALPASRALADDASDPTPGQFIDQPSALTQQEDKIFAGSSLKHEKAQKENSASADEENTGENAAENVIPKDSLVDAMEKAAQAPDKTPSKKIKAAVAKSHKKPKVQAAQDSDSELAGLDDKETDLTLQNEVTSSDADAYNDAADESAKEAGETRKEIKDLEHQLSTAKTADSRAAKNVALQAKKLELAKRLAKETRAKLASTTARQHSVEKKLARLQAQVEAAESRAHEAQQKNSDEQAAIAKLQSSNNDLNHRLKIAQADIAREKKKRKTLHEKHARLARQGHALQRRLAVK